MPLLVPSEVRDRIDALEIPFNAQGYDKYGVSKKKLVQFFSMLHPFYRRYFRVACHGIQHVPERGRVMLIGNHSGGLPIDGGMALASLFFDHAPPRLGHGMVEKFAARMPFVSQWFDRIGQLTGLPEHAVRFLEDDRALLVFPEGVRGVGKLYQEGYKLARFGTGFVRLALKTKTPIVPFAFVGGVEALPTIMHLSRIGKLVGAPYLPVTPYGLPVPLPLGCVLVYGAPIRFIGDGTESDEVIDAYVGQVKNKISELIDEGLDLRAGRKTSLEETVSQ